MARESDGVPSSHRSNPASAVIISPNVKQLDRFLTIAEALIILGISASTFYRMIKQNSKYYNPKFPAPVYITKGRKGILLSLLQKYMTGCTRA